MWETRILQFHQNHPNNHPWSIGKLILDFIWENSGKRTKSTSMRGTILTFRSIAKVHDLPFKVYKKTNDWHKEQVVNRRHAHLEPPSFLKGTKGTITYQSLCLCLSPSNKTLDPGFFEFYCPIPKDFALFTFPAVFLKPWLSPDFEGPNANSFRGRGRFLFPRINPSHQVVRSERLTWKN